MADHHKKAVYNDNNNAFAYYRYSSLAQREESIKEQKEAAERYAEAHGLHIIGEYKDDATSGTIGDREGLMDMLYHAKIMKPGHLIAWKVDRLGRDSRDFANTLYELREAGVKTEYVGETMPEDEGERRFIEGMYALIAEQFIFNHKKNVIRGLEYNAERCLFNGGKPPYGYVGTAGKPLEIDPVRGPIVQKIFREYADGKKSSEIVQELNEAGVRSSHGKPLQVSFITHVLSNTAYLGIYKWGGKEIEGGVPRLVDDGTWDKCQRLMERNARGGRRPKKRDGADSTEPDGEAQEPSSFWLTGHLYCGMCGETMHSHYGTNHSGKPYYYYMCTGHENHRCSKKSVPAHLVEGMVTRVMEEILQDSSIRFMIAHDAWLHYEKMNEGSGAYLESLKNEQAEVKRKLDNVMKAIEEGIVTKTTKAKLEELENRQQMLQDAADAEEARQQAGVKEETILRFLDSFVNLHAKDSADREKLLNTLVDKIYVYDDEIVVTVYYSDDKRKVSFEDYKEALKNDPYEILQHRDGVGEPVDGVDPEVVMGIKDSDEGNFPEKKSSESSSVNVRVPNSTVY